MLVFRRAVEVAAPVEAPVETPVVVSDDAETVEEPVMNGSADTETPAETDRASV
jgi:hypothetical protein